MSKGVAVTILIENTVNTGGLQAEHGIAFLVRSGGDKVLFDTGQSHLIQSNTEAMGLTLDDVNAIALSHGHYDHTGGLQAVLASSPGASLFLHPQALSQKFSGNLDGTSRVIGMPSTSKGLIEEPGRSVKWTTLPTEVIPGVFVTGEIPRTNNFEDTGGRFFLDAACTQPDPLKDDQALYFDTHEGLVVLLGCAHAGVVNTVNYVQSLTHGRPIHAILGGLHLQNASSDRMAKTLEQMRGWNVQRFAPGHCTGVSAVTRLWQEFPGRCLSCAVGTTIHFAI